MEKILFKYKEFGMENGPSIKDYFSDTPHPNKSEIIKYLKNGTVILPASGYYDDIVTGQCTHITIAIMTDGEYDWLSVFPYYVEKYNLQLPEEFIRKIIN